MGLQLYQECPKELILGPMLFLVYMNNITDCIKSKIKLFVDDIKIYREIRDFTTDTVILQSDLHSINDWSNTWQMQFNAEKCESMRITHSCD